MRIVAEKHDNGEVRIRRQNRVPSKVSPDRSDPPLASNAEFQENRRLIRAAILGLGHIPRPGWGMTPRKTKFGIRARRTIKRVGGTIGLNDGRRVALTFTLPGDTPAAFQAMADYSGYIANRVKTWIYDNLIGDSKPDWFYVWELQERGALHLHFCIQCDFIADYHTLKRKGKEFWIRVMQQVQDYAGVRMSLNKNGVEWFERPDKIQYYCQIVRSSVGSYFAKYLGKDKGKTGEHVDNGLRPSRWWGCSRSLLQRSRENSEVVIGNEMSESQTLDFMVYAHEAAMKSMDVVFTRHNEWNGDDEIICFGPSAQELIIAVEAALGNNKSSLIEAKRVPMNIEANRAYRYIRRRWSNNDGRLRLAELIDTRTYYWELLSRLMIDRECVPDEQILQLQSFITDCNRNSVMS